MIRINLLPIKAAQKKELLQGQLVIVALVLLATAGVCGGAHMHIVNKVDDMQVKIDSKRAEISKLSKAIREVRDFEKRQKDLRAKLNVLETLKDARVGPIHLLDELYKAMPDKLWLTRFQEGAGRAKINGIGSSEETVALFMKNLEASEFFTDVELRVTKQKVESQIKFHEFELSCRTVKNMAKSTKDKKQ